MTVNWTTGSSGNAKNVIVVMRSGSAVNADPVDGTTYSANAAFGSGAQVGSGNYVVYKGTGTSVPVTGLSPSTTYYAKVYAFAAGAGGTENYNTTAPPAGSQATTASSAPTVTTPTATAVGGTTATLGANVTSNGGGTLTANGTCWGLTATPTGNCLDQGSHVTGAFTQNRNSLPEGSMVYYRGYATNSAGSGYTSDGTIYTEPLQPTAMSFTNVGGAGMTVNWATGSSGNAKNVIVVMRSGTAVNADPVDGTTYTANAAFGSGTQIGSGNYVVYKGTGTSVPVTGLLPGTTYYVKVYAFAAGAGGTENYNITSPPAGSQITAAGSPPPAPTLVLPTPGFSGQVGYTDIDTPLVLLTWNPSVGATEYYCDVWSDGGGSYSSGWTTALSCDPGDLPDNYDYNWHVKARNAYGESAWSETWYWYDAW